MPPGRRTQGAGEVYLHHEVPCGPCGKRSCPLGHHQCMRDLSVRRVFAAVLEQLSQRHARAGLEHSQAGPNPS